MYTLAPKFEANDTLAPKFEANVYISPKLQTWRLMCTLSPNLEANVYFMSKFGGSSKLVHVTQVTLAIRLGLG